MTRHKSDSEPRHTFKKGSPTAIFDIWVNTRCVSVLTQQESEDDYLVRFFVQWAPFGGGDEVDIMSQFGVNKDCYLSRLRSLALSARVTRFPNEIQELLLALAMSPD